MATTTLGPIAHPDDGPTTSAIDQLNANILAQGLTKVPVNLNGLPTRQRENVSKVIACLIERRQDDLTQLENLSLAHTSLAYDHERLSVMHRRLKGELGDAQRELEAAKAQVSVVAARLKKEEAAHRTSRDEGNKARTALAFVRTQAQYETKKRDAQVEKTMQNWQKITSEHARLLSANITTGLLCLNPVEGSQNGPRVDSFWDPSIKALDQIRVGLQEENEAFRHVTLSTANKLQKLLATVNSEEPPPFLEPSAFFNDLTTSTSQVSSSTSHPNAADSKLKSMIGVLQSRIEAGFAVTDQHGQSSPVDPVDATKLLQGRVRDLETELAGRHEVASDYLRLLEEFAKSAAVPNAVRDASDDSDAATLAKQRKALLSERQQLTDKAVKLGHARAVLEAERLTFEEECRAKRLQELLADVPTMPSSVVASATVDVDLDTATAELEGVSLAPLGPYEPRQQTSTITPIAAATKPLISSPLRSSTSRSPRSSERSPRSASISRRRSVKRGPATPLARLVLQKVTIEKASERKAQKMLQKLQQTQSEDTPGAALHQLGSIANRGSRVSDILSNEEKSAGRSTSRGISPGRRKAIIETQKAARTGKETLLTSSQTARAAVLDKASGVGPRGAAAGNGVWR